jgi:hypothetical protein
MQSNKKKDVKVDNAILVLDEKVENTFYRVIMVCGIIIAVIGLEVWQPMIQVDGLGFLAIGLLTMAFCLLKIGKTNATIQLLSRKSG